MRTRALTNVDNRRRQQARRTIMPSMCCAPGCFSKPQQGLSFFFFPTDVALHQAWLTNLQNHNPDAPSFVPESHHRLCSLHFVLSDFASFGLRKRLKKGAIPTLFGLETVCITIQLQRLIYRLIAINFTNNGRWQ